MTVIFITHDIGLAYYVSDAVYIMEHGKFVQSGPPDAAILHLQEDYIQRLISESQRSTKNGIPQLLSIPLESGC